MKIVLQRVSNASVRVGEDVVGEIQQGYVALVGFGLDDSKITVDIAIEKIKKLRLFPDKAGKTNRSILDINGELLIVSQFTLYADCQKGNRPSFTNAAKPDIAHELYNYFIDTAKPHFAKVAHGTFAASMQVALVNDGPFTVVLDL